MKANARCRQLLGVLTLDVARLRAQSSRYEGSHMGEEILIMGIWHSSDTHLY
jgi:hypothetical protein